MSLHRPYRIAMMMELESGFGRHFNIYTGAHRFAAEQDWELIIDEFADYRLGELGMADARPYDGVIARSTEMLAVHARRLRMPVVNVWMNSPMAGHLPSVFPDCTEIGRLRAEHLLSRGVTRFIALISDARAHRIEYKAFLQSIESAGHTCELIDVSHNVAGTIKQWRGIEGVLDQMIAGLRPPVGIFTGSEMVGRLLAQRCQSHGLNVPKDVAIMAGHNESAFVEQPSPSLTSIDVGYERIGYEAARLLGQLMDGQPTPHHAVLISPTGVVVRESTDFHVVEDEQVDLALRFIAEHYHEKIGPDTVAEAVGLQTRTLQNRFKKSLGWPVATEIRRLRVERAKRALIDTDRLVADISEEVGYPDPMRLYEVFRREVGMSPSEYRKQRMNHTS